MSFVARSGANLPRVGDFNSLVILDQIRRSRSGISRVELAAASGLSAQTVSNQVARLIEAGLIVEGERVAQQRGKPRTLLNLNPQAGYVVGVHIDPAQVSFVLTDISVTVLRRSAFPMPAAVEGFCALAKAQVAELIDGLPPDRILGVGIAAPGPVDGGSGSLVHPPNLRGWERVPLRELVSRATGLPTFIQKDSLAALTGELWFRNRSLSGSTLFVYLGFGLGFAFAQRGQVIEGFSGNAGEVGHLRVSADGPRCFCGRRGCLGTAVSPRVIVQQAVAAGLIDGVDDLADPIVLAELMDRVAALARSGDPRAGKILRERAAELASGILALVDFIDASDVVLGGHTWAAFSPYLEDGFRREFDRLGVARNLHRVELHSADFGEWMACVGAACLVLDNAFSPRPSMLASSE